MEIKFEPEFSLNLKRDMWFRIKRNKQIKKRRKKREKKEK